MSLFASLARRGLARRGAPSMAVGRAFGARYMSAEKPSLAEAKEMPTTYSAMSNDIILAMSAAGDLLARQERLTRHVMAVDGVDWDDADVVVKNIASVRRAWGWLRRGQRVRVVGLDCLRWLFGLTLREIGRLRVLGGCDCAGGRLNGGGGRGVPRFGGCLRAYCPRACSCWS